MASIFSAIIAGQIPGRFVWADDDVVAFLTIAPVAPGHTLIVPRAEIDQWQDVPADTLNKVLGVAQHIGQAVRAAWDAPRAGLLIAGIEVPHLHVHVFPAWDAGGFDISRANPNPTADELDDAAGRIRTALRANGHAEFVAD